MRLHRELFFLCSLVACSTLHCDRPLEVVDDEDGISDQVLLANVLYEPRIIRPKNGSILRNREVILRWSWIPSATNYTVQVSKDTLFTDPVVAVEEDTIFYRTPPLEGNAFYWRVRSQKGPLTSDWSRHNLFYLQAD